MSDCVFCRIVSGDIPAAIIRRDEHAVAFRDLNPQAPTHVLVVPTTHVESTRHATSPDGEALLGRVLRFAAETARDLGLDDDGYRLVINAGRHGGQTVYHLHVHLLGGRAMHWPPG